MYSHNAGRSRQMGFSIEGFIPSDQSGIFGSSASSHQTRHIQPETQHQADSDAASMDWLSHTSSHEQQYQRSAFSAMNTDPGDLMEFDDLDQVESHSSAGVRSLVSEFENKAFVPPLPPRPINDISTSLDTQSSFSNSYGNFHSSSHDTRISSPLSPTDSVFGSFSRLNRVTSPFTTPTIESSSSFMSLSSFPTMSPIHSPGVGSSSAPFGSLGSFLTNHDTHHQQDPFRQQRLSHQHITGAMDSDELASSIAQTKQPQVGGTPGFEIWRPPTVPEIKVEPSTTQEPLVSLSSPTKNSAGFTKPPVPAKPKPLSAAAGSQFIMEYANGNKTPKGKTVMKPPPPPPPPRPQPNPIITDMVSPVGISSPMSPPIKIEDGAGKKPAGPRPSISKYPIFSPRPSGSRSSREQVPAEIWEQYKFVIRTLYLEERKPLKEVMTIMSERYNFQATPKMYKSRFSQWGFVKNNTEDEVKRLLSMKFQRDAEGKVSEFVRNGKVINIGTYLKRKGVTEYDLVDFELPADLPAYVRCRTPTPPTAPGLIRSPDLVRAHELVIGSVRKAFLQCHKYETETNAQINWSIIQVWGAWSSEMLLEANFFLEAGDSDNGGSTMMRAFNQLEQDLKQLSPQGIVEILLSMVKRDLGMITALCKYLAAYCSTNFERNHPLRQIFSCLYEIQQKHGSGTLSEFLASSITVVAEELESIYGQQHPYVARTWIDLALFYNEVDKDKAEKLIRELRTVYRELEAKNGAKDPDSISLRYAILQLLYSSRPNSEGTKQAAMELWTLLREMGVMHPMKDPRPNVYCYHSPVKVDPWSKRCRRRYEVGVAIFEEHIGVRMHPYFEEDFHTSEHAPEAQNSWMAAMEQQSAPHRFQF